MLGLPNSSRPSWLRWRPAWRRLHGWLALATGVVLLIVVLSGTILLFQPEIERVIFPSLYDTTETDQPISRAEALENVREDPDLPHFRDGGTVVMNHGVYEVYSKDFMRQAHVDPGTGDVLGVGSHDAGFFGFLANLHTCGLTCKDYPGTMSFLKTTKMTVLGNHMNLGTLILGLSAVVLVFLAVSGLILWWPGIKRWVNGIKIRRKRGAYATNYDIHKVFGFVALPFLLMWAVTGAGFEFKQVEDAWYAITPGNEPGRFPTFESDPKSAAAKAGETINPQKAEQIALQQIPDSEFASIGIPGADDKKGYYDFYVTDGWDGYTGGQWPGDAEVVVDKYSGEAEQLWPDENRSVGWTVWEDWSYPVHAGVAVPWVPRFVWLLFGLTPLLLAITGTTVWWIRRRKKKRKRKPRATAAAPA